MSTDNKGRLKLVVREPIFYVGASETLFYLNKYDCDWFAQSRDPGGGSWDVMGSGGL